MALLFSSKSAKSSIYRPEIDGLRAIAVLPVVFYHAGISLVSGGFVGVDIFFVISGYLITSILLREINNGRFSFAAFYERRMRRIFPALFVVVFFSTVAAALIFPPEDFSKYGKSLVAMTVFVSNIVFQRESNADGYFGDSSGAQPLLHTWSLSVEEQFYICFPIILILLNRYVKTHKDKIFLLGLFVSFGISAWGVQHRPLEAFYSLLPRSWELILGAFLALKTLPLINNRALREIIGLIGIALIAYSVFVFTAETLFPGLSALYPCLGAFLIIYSSQNGNSLVKIVLSWPPLVFVGVISYSLYLWHWPIIVFSKYFAIRPLRNGEIFTTLVCSIAMAFISFEFIESPFRGISSVGRKQIFRLGIVISVTFAALGLTIYGLHGLPQRYDVKTRRIILENTSRKTDYPQAGDCGNWRTDIRKYSDVKFCEIGRSSDNILFWGDSHIKQLYSLIQDAHDEGKLHNKGVVFALAAGCPLTEHMNVARKGFHCDLLSGFAMERAEKQDINTVVIGFSTWWQYADGLLCAAKNGHCEEQLSRDEVRRRFAEELYQHVHALRSLGKRVVVVLPFPFYDKSIPDVEIHNAVFGSFGSVADVSEITSPSMREKILAVARIAGADIYDPRKSLCVADVCRYQINGISLYKDNNHFAASQLGVLESDFLESLSGSENK